MQSNNVKGQIGFLRFLVWARQRVLCALTSFGFFAWLFLSFFFYFFLSISNFVYSFVLLRRMVFCVHSHFLQLWIPFVSLTECFHHNKHSCIQWSWMGKSIHTTTVCHAMDCGDLTENSILENWKWNAVFIEGF